MKLPSVRRVMLRLANAEAAITRQQAQLGELGGLLQELSAAEASNRSLLAELAEQGHQAQIDALNDRIQRLSADHERQRALLTEISQHLPPAQRANLEATLHGQQLQLGALNATMHANQIQLGALNDIVQRLSAESGGQHGVAQEKQALVEKIARLQHENRLLKVGHGATFEELAANGKASNGAPYRFDDLLSLRQGGAPPSGPSVPPLVFVHVPKAGGTTLNNILMKNYRYRLDSYGNDFFPRYYPDEFVSLVQAPVHDDTRRPAFFTGHIDLANDVFRYMPVRYVAITMLREPVQRVVSHYRFHSTLRQSPLAAEIAKGDLGIVDYFKHFRATIPLQYEMFAPPLGDADDRTGRAAEALRNLEDRISFFGLQDRFDEFVVLLAELLGLPDVLYKPLNKTPSSAATVSGKQTEELKELLAEDIAFYEGAVQLYQGRAAALPFDLAAGVKAFKQEEDGYLERRNDRHPWSLSYS